MSRRLLPAARRPAPAPPSIAVTGIPDDAPEVEAALLRSRLLHAAGEYLAAAPSASLELAVRAGRATPAAAAPAVSDTEEPSAQERSAQFRAADPLFAFDRLVLPEQTMSSLTRLARLDEVAATVFEAWGLRRIEPSPSVAMCFYGAPGTGKTLAAHATAHMLGRPILATKASQLESMYHGVGAKNVEAAFLAAERDGAVLFVDEAEQLLSSRLASPSQGSEHAINAIRNEVMLSLDRFRGVAVFASNLVESFDPAVSSRIRMIPFLMPDAAARREIWRRHLPAELPLEPDVSVDELAAADGVSGRDIKHAVIDAATGAALEGRPAVAMADLRRALGALLRDDPPQAPSDDEIAAFLGEPPTP